MSEARIRTGFGDIRITFQNDDELQAALQSLEEQITVIQQVADKVAPRLPRSPKPGYETAYRFTPDGSVELLVTPPNRNEAVALVLHAYSPDLVRVEEIERITGIREVSRRVLTLTQNREHFYRLDDKWGLTFEGRQMVEERIGATLAHPTEPEQIE